VRQPERTIETVLNLDNGDSIEAKEFFMDEKTREAEIFQLRTKIEEQIQKRNYIYVCIYCKQPVAIRGRAVSKRFYFTHLYKSNDCIIKSTSRLTEEQVRRVKYNGQKESKLHLTLKNFIGEYLKYDSNVKAVKIDQVYREREISREWRKPDVLAIYENRKIAFELQLSTTFLSVIVERTIFYRERGIYLIWIFPNFSLNNDLQRFTEKDIYYNNNFNVYALDEEAVELSKLEGKLYFKCYYKEFTTRTNSRWNSRLITVDQLTFKKDFTAFYHDYSSDLEKIERDLKTEREIEAEKRRIEWVKNKVNSAVSYLRDFFKEDKEVLYDLLSSPLDSIQTEEEIQLLNDELKFNSKDAFISDLIKIYNKPNFLKLICDSDKIYFGFQNLTIESLTPFQFIIKNHEINFRPLLAHLFRKGYKLTEQDDELINNLLNHNPNKENIEKWGLVKAYSRLVSKRHAYKINQVDKVIFSILSLEHDRVIGFGFKNLKEVTNNFFEYHTDFGDIYLHAMKVFKRYDNLIYSDKSDKMKIKIERFKNNKPGQRTDFNDLFYELFPELV